MSDITRRHQTLTVTLFKLISHIKISDMDIQHMSEIMRELKVYVNILIHSN